MTTITTTMTLWSSSLLAGGIKATRGKYVAQMAEMTMTETMMMDTMMTTRGHYCKGGGEGAEGQLEGWIYV
jgi:hypothetical protein